MIQFFLHNPIIAALIWAVLYAVDYSSTVWFARYYQKTLSRHFKYEGGVELNPIFELDIARPRWINLRFLALLTIMVGLLILFGVFIPWTVNFEFMLGAFMLLWLFVDLRHIRNLYIHLHLKDWPDAMSGHIRQSYWLGQRLVSYDAFVFGIVYFLAWLASGIQFFAGGSFVCFSLAGRHFFLANRKPALVCPIEIEREL